MEPSGFFQSTRTASWQDMLSRCQWPFGTYLLCGILRTYSSHANVDHCHYDLLGTIHPMVMDTRLFCVFNLSYCRETWASKTELWRKWSLEEAWRYRDWNGNISASVHEATVNVFTITTEGLMCAASDSFPRTSVILKASRIWCPQPSPHELTEGPNLGNRVGFPPNLGQDFTLTLQLFRTLEASGVSTRVKLNNLLL